MSRLRFLLPALLVAGALTAPVAAVDLRDVLTDYTSTSWSRKDGLSGPVWAIAQDGEGFLWLAADDGLVRFDGMRFASWERLGGAPLPRLPVRALRFTTDGNLWIGFGGSGGVARVEGKTIRVYAGDDEGVSGAVTTIAEDSAHTVWVATGDGLFQFADDRWRRLGAGQGLPDAPATSVLADEAGNVWVGTAAGVYRRPPLGDRFQQIEAAGESIRSLALSTDPSGRLWTSDPVVGFRAVGVPPRAETEGQSGRGYRIVHDRHGNLWVGTIGQGLWRVRIPPSGSPPGIERATVLSGLSSDAVRSVFEDRDGNIWAGTTEGVDRLVPHRITPWTSLGLVGTLDAAADGRVWVGTEDEIIRFSNDGGWRPDPQRLYLRGARTIRADARAGLWILTNEELFRVTGGVPTRVPFPVGVPASWTEAVAINRTSGIWVVVIGGEILRDVGDRLQVFDRVDELKDGRITAAMADRAGRLWLAYSESRVGVLSGRGQFHSYGPDDGLGRGPYYAMHEDGDGHIWIGSATGLSRFDGAKFTSVGRGNGIPAGGIYALTGDTSGQLWLATGAGVIRLAPDAFDTAAKDPAAPMYFRLYDTSDGLAGFPVLLSDHNAVRAGDGTLWFVSSRGLSVINPAALAATRPTPHVAVDEMRADDRPVTSERLAAGTAKLEIEYTAPDLTYPLKMRFRYRLEGFESDWVNAGSRRQVLYTNLPPGDYAFHVAVSSDEGRWSEAGTTRNFSIAPRFYQTLWFVPLCIVLGVGLIAGAWQLRLRQLRRQFSLVLGERVRLSRELHDTLLQSLVGVALEFDAVSKTLESSPAAARERVVKIREHVEEYIREARRSIWSLRSPALETGDLIEALRESAERATDGQSVALAFDVVGTPRRLESHVEHQALRIGQEAVLNAVRHGRARHIGMMVEYGARSLALRITDDGQGFEPGRTAEGTTDHYGIITMRERAQQAGGDVTIASAPGRGTTVEARLPTTDAPAQEAQP